MTYLIFYHAVRAQNLVEEMLPDMRVHRGQRIIEYINVILVVDGSRKRHSLLLPAAQVDTLKRKGREYLNML